MFSNYDLNEKYLIACSGGPDSMALLDMARKARLKIEVAHVNYHKRDTANRDEKIVKDYCRKYKIRFNKLDVLYDLSSGNFQAYAREQRYKYFGDICKKHKLFCVLVAHQKDDLIETYLMQINKKLKVKHYGLAPTVYLYYVFVKRPLLDCTKDDLMNYCIDNNIDFGIDESNLTDHYTRNRIRHSKVEKMSLAQKNNLVKKIQKTNERNTKKLIRVVSRLQNKNNYTMKQFLAIPNIKEGLRAYFGNKSDKFYDEMLRQIKESSKYLYKGEFYWISKEYGRVYIFEKPKSFSYTLNSIRNICNKNYIYFSLSKTGNSMQALTLYRDDFPITIRNVNAKDFIEMRYGKKKLNRFFIDNKILIKDREVWPIIINRNGSAIFVPEIGCDVNHYSQKPNLYMIKY